MKHQIFNYNIKLDVIDLINRSRINAESFRGKNILVTGGTGFFGVWMLSSLVYIRQLLQNDLDITVISRSPDFFTNNYQLPFDLSCITFLTGDVKDINFNGSDFTHLIHMATTSASETFQGEDQLNKLMVLYEGTNNILRQCSEKLKNVLFTSSGVAYGLCQSDLISEDQPGYLDSTRIDSSLAIGKLTAEYLISYYAKQLGYQFSIARCFSLAGQYLPLNLHYAFGNFANCALNQTGITVSSDGTDKRAYMYIGDAVAWLLNLIESPYNQILNVGSEKSISILDLARMFAKSAGTNVQTLNKSHEVGNFRRINYTPSTQKTRILYPHLQEWTSIEEIVSKTLRVS